MILPKDLLSENYRKPKVILCQTNKEKICQLDVAELNGTFKFNGYSEISFNVASVYQDLISGETKPMPYYDYIEGLRLVYLEGFGYFQLQNPEVYSDGIQEYKQINAYSLEYALSQRYLETFIINKGDVGDTIGSVDGVVLYNVDDQAHSLLHLVLQKAYGWTVGHVDTELASQSRSFEVDRESIYDFIMNEMCDTFKCYVEFDTINNTINVYSENEVERFIGDGKTKNFQLTNILLDTSEVTINGHVVQAKDDIGTKQISFTTAPANGDIIEVTNEFKSKYDTDVFVAFENLSNEMKVNYSADDIKTVLTVKGADDLDIRNVNFGLPSIMNLDYYHTPEWMGEDLYKKYSDFVDKQDKYMSGFYDIDRTGTLEESFPIVSSKDEFIVGKEITLPVISSTETFEVSSYKESFVIDSFVKEFVAEVDEQTFNEPNLVKETIICKDPTIEKIEIVSSTKNFIVSKAGESFELQDFDFNDKTIVKISDGNTERILDENEYSYNEENNTIIYNGTVPMFKTITLLLINYTNKYKINSVISEMSDVKADDTLLSNNQYFYDTTTKILTINIDLSECNYIYVYTYINTFTLNNPITSNSVVKIDDKIATNDSDYKYLNNKLIVYFKLTSDNSIEISTPQGTIQKRFNLSNPSYEIVSVKINDAIFNKYNVSNGVVDLSNASLTYGDTIIIKSINNKFMLTDVDGEIISVQIGDSDVEYDISGETLTIGANKFANSNVVKVISINNKFIVAQTRKNLVYVKVQDRAIRTYMFDNKSKTLSINKGVLSKGDTVTILFIDNDFTLHDVKEKILSVKANEKILSSQSFSYENNILTINVASLSENCNVEVISVDNSFDISSLNGDVCEVLLGDEQLNENDFDNSNETLIIKKYDSLKVGENVTVRAIYNQFKLSNTKNKILEVLVDDTEITNYTFKKSQNLVIINDEILKFGSSIIIKSFDNYFTVTNNFGDKYNVEKISGEQKETLSKNDGAYTYQNNVLTINADVEDGDNIVIRKIGSEDALLVVSGNAGKNEILLNKVSPTLNIYTPKVGDYIIYTPGYSQRLEELYKLIDEELELQNSVPSGYEDNYEEISIKQGSSIFEKLPTADVSTLGYVRKIIIKDDNNQEISYSYYICQMKFSIDKKTEDKSYIYEWVQRDIKFGDKGIHLIQEDIDIYTSISQVQIDAGWSNDKSDSNYKYYEDNLTKLNNAKKALEEQNKKIKEKRNEINEKTEVISNISEIIDVKNNFSYNDLERLSLLLREDEYSDDCFVVTELDTDNDKINIQKELLVAGYKELKRISKPKLSFSASMKNIYAMPEFKPILKQFKLGNFVRVAIRKDYIRKVRLLEVQINFDDLSNFSCNFGDLIAIKDEADIHAELLQQAITAGKSVASTSSYWQKGADIATSIDDKIRKGLIDATTSIKSNSAGQDISWDNYGIHLRKVIDGKLDNHEGWITNNQFLYSDDNFATTKSVFGEYEVDGKVYYGLLAEAVIAGLVEGSKIVGGTIKIGPTDEDGVAAFQVNEDGTVYMSKNDELNKLSYFSFDPNNGLIIAANGADDNNSKFFSRLSTKKIEFGMTATFNIITSEPTKSNFGNKDYCIWEKTENNSTLYTYYENKLNPQPIEDFIDLKDRNKNDKTILGHIITYFSKDGTYMKQAEIEGSLKVGTNPSIEQNPYISLGSFRLQVEQNGSLSIIAI